MKTVDERMEFMKGFIRKVESGELSKIAALSELTNYTIKVYKAGFQDARDMILEHEKQKS